MKKERNARKELLDLYLYMDMKNGHFYKTKPTKEMEERYDIIKDKYDKIYGQRYFGPDEWNEYYGLFKLRNGRVGVDPKRMDSKLYHPFTKKQLEIMNRRNTTYFHPKKMKYNEYFVNCFVDEIEDIIKSFKETHKPIIDKSIENIKKIEELCPGDYYNLQCGISGPMAAEAWARWQNEVNASKVAYKKYELFTSLYAQFFHYMTSRIEAKSVELFSKISPKMKKWRRDLLYDNVNTKKLSSRDLPSFKYHDELYLIWNFIKHNSLDTYEKLKNAYSTVLIKHEYKSGDLAIHYLKLSEKLIIELLNGTKQFFIEWCELNLDEDYSEAQWNYDEYFIDIVDDNIESLRNPLGLQWWDELD